MIDAFHHERRIDRRQRLKQLFAIAALKTSKADFSTTPPLISIIGDHISDSIRTDGLYERTPLEILRQRILTAPRYQDCIAVDVGANIGNHTIVLAELFKRVLAFEPNPLARRILELNLELNDIKNVDVYPVGLSDERGSATLRFDEANLGAATTSPAGRELAKAAQVELAVGDDEVGGLGPIGFIKVDVEGAEDKVLRGLATTIDDQRPVVMLEQLAEAIDPRERTSSCFRFLVARDYVAFDIAGPRGLSARAQTLVSLITGRSRQQIRRVTELEPRNYLCLVFIPSEKVDELRDH